MDVIVQIIASGLTLGAMYAVSTIGLSLVYGSLNMLNMAHGALLALGGYVCLYVMSTLGLPAIAGLVAAIVVCGLVGLLVYATTAAPMLGGNEFETRVFIATIGFGAILENLILRGFGPQPTSQPLRVDGDIVIGNVHIPNQNLLILGVALGLMIVVALVLRRTRLGRAIRATAQNRDAARLLGVAVSRVYLYVLMLSGAVAGICGLLLSALVQLSPSLGNDPMLKAFIMCVVAGLGTLPGAVLVSFALALLEAWVQYAFGARWGFPMLLCAVVLVLIWRPGGLLGRVQPRRM